MFLVMVYMDGVGRGASMTSPHPHLANRTLLLTGLKAYFAMTFLQLTML